MKTISVKVWIEVCPFDSEVVFKRIGSILLDNELNKIHEAKITNIKNNVKHVAHFYIKDGETRETIIQSLYAYQKSLLPKGYYIEKLTRGDSKRLCFCSVCEEKTAKFETKGTFYDPETRIITITKFLPESEGI